MCGLKVNRLEINLHTQKRTKQLIQSAYFFRNASTCQSKHTAPRRRRQRCKNPVLHRTVKSRNIVISKGKLVNIYGTRQVYVCDI